MTRRSLACLVVLAACGSAAPQPRPGPQAPPAVAPAAPPPAGDEVSRWIAKLGDPREVERAVTELEVLGDPRAIAALGEAWSAQGRPIRLLQAIVGLAKPAHWDEALPFLRRAIVEVDEANPRSVDSATRAADAIGEARLVAGAPALIELAQRPPTKKLVLAQVAAIRALGKLAGDQAAALVAIVDRDPPPHPDTVSEDQRAAALEQYDLFLRITGMSILVLADLRAETATGSLVLAMYKVPALQHQIGRALVAIGPPAADELRKILRGQHAAVNELFRARRLDRYCGEGGRATCKPISAMDFYAAQALGGLHDPSAVPELLAVLDRPPSPAYYLPGDDAAAEDRAGPTQHVAVFDALGKLGSAAAARKVHDLWHGVKAPRRNQPAPPGFETKVLAIVKYPFLARDLKGVGELAAIAADNGADREAEYHDQLRTVSAEAFARMSRDPGGIKVLQGIAKKYLDASAEKRKLADGKPRKDKEAADKDLEKEKKKVDALKVDLLELTRDTSKSADDIRAATKKVKDAEIVLKGQKLWHREMTRRFKEADGLAKAYQGFARMFQVHIARIEVAIRCKEDLACYAASLRLTTDEAAKNVLPYVKDVFDWTPEEQRRLIEAAVDRAMLELGKRGDKAQELTAALLEHVATDSRAIRQAILLALPRIAKAPCAECVEQLDAAIEAAQGKPALTDLAFEARSLRAYFARSGTK
jgi:hypothetical protein